MWLRWSVILVSQMFWFPSPAPAQKSGSNEKIVMVYRGESWALQIDSPGLVVKAKERKPDGREYLAAENSETKILLSVMMERDKGLADEAGCPDYLTNRVHSMPAQMHPTDAGSSRIAGRAVIEYLVPEMQKLRLRPKNFVACLTHEDVYIDVRLSKVLFNPADEELFTSVLSKMNILEADASEGKTPSADSLAGSPIDKGKTSLD